MSYAKSPDHCWILGRKIRIAYRDLGEVHGYWIYGHLTILLNEEDVRPVQARTLAHEVTHAYAEMLHGPDATYEDENLAVFGEALFDFCLDEDNDEVVSWMSWAKRLYTWPTPETSLKWAMSDNKARR